MFKFKIFYQRNWTEIGIATSLWTPLRFVFFLCHSSTQLLMCLSQADSSSAPVQGNTCTLCPFPNLTDHVQQEEHEVSSEVVMWLSLSSPPSLSFCLWLSFLSIRCLRLWRCFLCVVLVNHNFFCLVSCFICHKHIDDRNKFKITMYYSVFKKIYS